MVIIPNNPQELVKTVNNELRVSHRTIAQCRNNQNEKTYKFRKINMSNYITYIHLDKKDYILEGKTAIEIDNSSITKSLFNL